MATSDDLLCRWMTIRAERNRVRDERTALLCERSKEGAPLNLETLEYPAGTTDDPCWKQAYTDEDGHRIINSSQWCQTCQRRQALTADLKTLVRKHGGAMRGLIRHGKALLAKRDERERTR